MTNDRNQKSLKDNLSGEAEQGRYLYCIADSGEEVNFGNIGIEEAEVYTIPYQELSAVVHNCPSEPYKSDDNEIVKNWVMTHQKVVQTAWDRFGTIIPSGFDTIVKGEVGIAPEENLVDWLKKDYQGLKDKMAKVKGKAEYGVQISWEPRFIAQKITNTDTEIKKLDEEIKTKSKGMAYMYRQKLEKLLREAMEREADLYFKDFYSRIKLHVDDIHIDKVKRGEKDRQMIMNVSCLLPKERAKGLGEELEKIAKMEGFFVRFTGPWPPYSFA